MLRAADVSAAPEMEARAEIRRATQTAFVRSDFVTLNNTARSYRTAKSRTSSGLWLLTLFYSGIDDLGDTEGRDAQQRERLFAQLESRTALWTKQFPDEPVAHIAHANMLIKHAWAYRGGGVASTVARADWAPFYQYIAKARAYLEANKKVASIDPKWYEQMISIATAQGWERPAFDSLLAEALEREPLFYQTYFGALNYLLPKWHGNITEVEAFAQNAVKRTAAIEGGSMYARIYWYASQSQFDSDLFAESRVSWPRMRDGFDDMIKRYPDAWNLNNFAKFACLAEDKAKARELMPRVSLEFVSEAWPSSQQSTACLRWAKQPD